MTIAKAAELLQAEIICGEERKNEEIISACGADMMSDVLAFVKDQAVLLTGLCNPQTIRTAEMMDIICIVFVRGKKPGPEIIALARASDIAVLATDERMYPACGKLYANGLVGGSLHD